jgi:predicted phage terminase large subunit-like protein
MLRSETRLPVLPVKPLGDKNVRANACSPLVESGRVLLPEAAPWLRDFLDEVTSFPNALHDDMVDAMSQALNYLSQHAQPMEFMTRRRRTAPRVGR